MLHGFPLDRTLISLAVAACFTAGTAQANPTGPQVVSGSASFQQPNAATLNVTNTPGAIINWQGFSIGAGEVTRFIQQSAASSVLNRVVTGDVSKIYGSLLSNGQVYLINTGGILVGPGAVVDTAGFVASTLNMVDADFLAGKLKFSGDASSGSIVNQGWIRTGYGGKVVLIAPQIENSGLVHTPGGDLVLAAGQKLTVTSLDHPEVQFEVQAPTDSVVNLGKLLADGGAVGVFAGTLKHSGDIRANSLVYDQAGQIVLRAANEVQLAAGSTTSADGKVGGSVTVQAAGGLDRVAGSVSAQGSSGKGGEIRILGETVAVVENASVNVSGAAGGGQILVGGDYQGANAAVQNATRTIVGPDARLRADATSAGEGGRVIVWSDDKTQFYGTLSAQGGPAGGDGGFAEVSGRRNLFFAGNATLGAPKGGFGTLLLDPIDLFVDTIGGQLPDIINESTDFPSNAVTVSPETLANIVGNVTLYASRYLRINSAIDLTTTVGATPAATPGKGLTAEVGNWATAKDALAASDPLKMTDPTIPNRLEIGAGITTANGAVSLSAPEIRTFSASTIATAGGAVALSATGAINASSLTVNSGAGALTATSAAGSLSLSQVAGSGNLSLSSTSGSINAGALTASGTATLTSSGGGISIGNLAAGGTTNLTSSSYLYTGGITTGGGALTANANEGQFSASGTIDTRPGQAGASGGAVTITARDTYGYYAYASVNTRAINAGNAAVSLTGESISTGGQAIDTTGAVTLTASHTDQYANASINAKVNNAASLTALADNKDASGNGGYSASVNIGSDTALNASSVTAKTISCYTYYGSCGGASVTLNAVGDVNVGTVTADAPVHTYWTSQSRSPFQVTSANHDPRYENISESVSIASSTKSILAASAGSSITAADVTLSTIPSGNTATGGMIGTTALPLKVATESDFTLKAGGSFKVELQGAGPNRLNVELGVAPTGLTWSGGSLTGTGSNNVTVAASATDATVTVSNFTLTGFDQRAYNQDPSIRLAVANGNLTATAISVPKGDNVGTYDPYAVSKGCVAGTTSCGPIPWPYYTGPVLGFTAVVYPSITSLPVTVSSSGTLQVDSYTRGGTGSDRAQQTTFQAAAGSLTLGTIALNRDALTGTASTGISLTDSLTTTGAVSLTNYSSGNIAIGNGAGDLLSAAGGVTITNSGSGTGDVSIVGIVASSGSVNIAANGTTATVGAAIDGGGLEVSAGSGVSISAKTIGNSILANPLDVAGSSVSLTTTGADAVVLGDIGFTGKPVIANTANLTVSAGANINVDTGAVKLQNLSVTASPGGVGASGLAQVSSNGTTYSFASDGTNFTLGDGTLAAVPADQFAGGQFKFVATSGSLTLNDINFSGGNGSFWAQTNGSLADVTQTAAKVINLGTGTLTLLADGDLSLQQVMAGGMNAANATAAGYFCPYNCHYGVQTFTTNGQMLHDAAWQAGTGGGGTWSVASRGAIATGPLHVGGVNFTAYSGGMTTGAIGTAAAPATSVALNTNIYPAYGNIATGAIEADSVNITSGSALAVSGNINAVNTGASSVSLSAYGGRVAVTSDGTANGTPQVVNASSVFMTGKGSITTGNINASVASPSSITIQSYYDGSTIVSTGSLDADSISIGSNYWWWDRPASVTTTGAIGGHTPGTSVSIRARTMSIGGNVTLDATSPGSVYLNADSGPLLVTGRNITAGDGSSITLYHNDNATTPLPFTFDTIDAGATGTVSVHSPAGILQQLVGSGGGITAGEVSLYSRAADISSFRAPLYLHGTTSLTLDVDGYVEMRLAGIGTGATPPLTSLNISRSDNSTGFILDGFATGQSFNIATVGTTAPTGVQLDLSSTTPLNFTYNNYDSSAGDIQVGTSGISSAGGNVSLYAVGALANAGTIATAGGSLTAQAVGAGGLTTGTINTVGSTSDGNVSLYAGGGNVGISSNINAGAGYVYVSADSITGTSTSTITSTSPTSVTLYTSGGDIGTSGTPIKVNAPTVNLSSYGTTTGGNIYASLTDTTTLTMTADTGFTVTDSVALTSLSLTTRADTAGATSLTTSGGQSFSFSRDSLTTPTTLLVNSVVAGPADLSIAASVGNLKVPGAGASTNVIDSANLTLNAISGTLTLDGSASAIKLENTAQNLQGDSIQLPGTVNLTTTGTQYLYANFGDINFTGTGTLTSASTQTLRASQDIVLQASGGAIALSAAGAQYVQAGRDTLIRAGSAAGAPVTLQHSGSGNQFIYANRNVEITADASSVTVTSSAGDQQIGTGNYYLYGPTDNVTVKGGAAAATVLIESTGSGNQILAPAGGLRLEGGAGAGATVIVRQAGSGYQLIGNSGTYSNDPTDTVTVKGGTGADAAVLVESAGQQWLLPGALSVLGGAGDRASAQVKSTSTSAQTIGECANYWICDYRNSYDYYYYSASGSISIVAGTGANAFAQITAAGPQRVHASASTTLTGSAATGGYAKLDNAGSSQKLFSLGTAILTAGTGQDANASVEYTGTGTQWLNSASSLALVGGGSSGGTTAVAKVTSAGIQDFDYSGATSLTGGAGASSHALITSVGSQSLGFGSLSLTGGGGAGSTARVYTDDTQYLSGGNVTLTGGAGTDAIARIHTPKAQTIYFSALTMNGALAGAGSYMKIDTPLKQHLSGSSISMTAGGVGETTVANAKAIVEGQEQEVYAGNITLRGGAGTAGNTSDALIRNIAGGTGNQIVRASGTLTLQGGHQNSTTGIINQGAGTQAVTGNSGIVLLSDPVTVPAHADSSVVIQNPAATAQTISASSGGVRLTNSGDGVVEITSGGSQSVQARYVEVLTSAGGAGNAKLGAAGDQWIRTTNENASPDAARPLDPGPLPDYGLRVAAFGTGTASIESGANQLLEITYPQMMQTTGLAAGLIVGGTQQSGLAPRTAVAGTSRIKAAGNQTIFAGTIWIETGLNASSPAQKFSEIKAGNDQVITTMNGGIMILGGAGNDTVAQIDPVNQTIVTNGTLNIIGGTGTNAVAQVVAGSGGTLGQTILATSGDILLDGGTGAGSNALILSGGLQTVGAAGTIATLSIPGGGSASITPLGSVPPGCAAPCLITSVATSAGDIVDIIALEPVLISLEDTLQLADTTLTAEDTTILTRRAPICR